MASPALKLGTRRSALARAQSAAVARTLEQLHPGLTVELIGIDTRGDRIQDRPLSTLEGKEFFTAEIDAALLDSKVDFTVHSYKDLSLERAPRLLLAAVPRREPPLDIALFSPDLPARLAAGHDLIIGSSSPRRASFVPAFLQQVLPRPAGTQMRVQLSQLRGNVDSRLRRLHEPRGSARHLDGIVLAFAGLSRLWADESGRALLRELYLPLPRMLLPLSLCPAAPAQGALAIECRREDAATAALLSAVDHAPTRRAIEVERALLAQRGGGCHQRFGATQIEVAGLGALLYVREADELNGVIQLAPPQLRWTPDRPLLAPTTAVRAWDGSRAEHSHSEPIIAGVAAALQRLLSAEALFVTHRRALPHSEPLQVKPGAHVWVPGVETWQALAQRGLWVEGCADGLGFAALQPLLAQPLLQLPPADQWTVLTHAHAQAQAAWPGAHVIATYRHQQPLGSMPAEAPPADATHLYWHSGAQFDRWGASVSSQTQHACGPGKTYEHLCRAGVQNLRMFPQAAQWRDWLGI